MLHMQVKKHIDSLSDEALYQYATDTEGKYADDALAYAKELVATRKFDPQQIVLLEESKVQQTEYEVRQQAEAADLPLSRSMRFLSFVAGMLGLTVPLLVVLICYPRFKERGQKKRARQMIMTMLAGFITLVALVAILGLVAWARQYFETTNGPRPLRY